MRLFLSALGTVIARQGRNSWSRKSMVLRGLLAASPRVGPLEWRIEALQGVLGQVFLVVRMHTWRFSHVKPLQRAAVKRQDKQFSVVIYAAQVGNVRGRA